MKKQERFTPEERNENSGRKRELIDLVASGEAILVVGAGSSVRMGYPDWPILVEKLENLAIECTDSFTRDSKELKNDPLVYAEKVKSHIEKTSNLDRYYALLQDLFGPKDPPCTDFHKRLVLLPFRGILTTNFDTVLEAALGEMESRFAYDNSLVIDRHSAGRVHEFLMSISSDKRTTRRIAHLHGKFDPPNSIILSSQDYYDAYGLDLAAEDGEPRPKITWTLHRKLLWAVLSTRRVVFVGFSMKDPYLNQMLDAVSADLWRWGKSIHYAIMSISPDDANQIKDRAESLKRDYGVAAVFYEDLDNAHQGLEHIVAEMVEHSSVEKQPLSDEPDWLEQMNQRMEGILNDEN